MYVSRFSTAGACGCRALARVQDRGKFRFRGVGTLEVISFTSDLFQSGRKVLVASLGSIGERAHTTVRKLPVYVAAKYRADSLCVCVLSRRSGAVDGQAQERRDNKTIDRLCEKNFQRFSKRIRV